MPIRITRTGQTVRTGIRITKKDLRNALKAKLPPSGPWSRKVAGHWHL